MTDNLNPEPSASGGFRRPKSSGVWCLLDVVITILAVVLLHSATLAPGGLIEPGDLAPGAETRPNVAPDHLISLDLDAAGEVTLAMDHQTVALSELDRRVGSIPTSAVVWLEVAGEVPYHSVCDVENLLSRHGRNHSERRAFQ